ncbi:MAG: pyridoxal-phosphate dependent enzyme [Pseudomonadota bacterium]
MQAQYYFIVQFAQIVSVSRMSASLALSDIDRLRAALAPDVLHTPSVALPEGLSRSSAQLVGKLELWQKTGSFKARGALANVNALTGIQKQHGVTAVSAGNHAIATAFAAAQRGVSAHVVMTATAPALRRQKCEAFGAQVSLADDVHRAFEMAANIERQEQRIMIHPFEGELTAMATAGVGRELVLDVGALDVVVVPVGGGGLAAGVAAAVKETQPDCRVIGVEPVGANSMALSREAGRPVTLPQVDTIADSLGAPMAMPITFALCEHYLDELVTVSDAQIVDSMRAIQQFLQLIVEPACAAALAAINTVLVDQVAGKRVGLIFCGSNMDLRSWQQCTGA